MEYNLRAIVSHRGELADKGHYVAFRWTPFKHEANRWVEFNDSKVEILSDRQDIGNKIFNSKNCVLLFYHYN